RISGDQRIRVASGVVRYGGLQVLAAHHAGRATSPLPRTRTRSLPLLQAHRRGLAQSSEDSRVHQRSRGHADAHQHSARSLDGGGSQRQVLRPREGGGNRGGRDRATVKLENRERRFEFQVSSFRRKCRAPIFISAFVTSPESTRNLKLET